MLIRATPLFRSMQVKIDRLNQIVREQVTGIRVIRAFLRSRSRPAASKRRTPTSPRPRCRSTGSSRSPSPSLMVVMNLSSVAVIWFGGQLIASGSMPVGNLTAFLSYILQILMSMMIAV